MTPEQPTAEYLAVDLLALREKMPKDLERAEWFSHFMVASQRALYAEHQLERRRQMNPEQPTPAEMAVDLTALSKIEGTPTPRQVAAKRAMYAEHAARELLAALRVAIDVLCPVVRDEWQEKEDAKAVMDKYYPIYGEVEK